MMTSHFMAACPACKGVGQLMGRVQYRDGRGCRNEMCTCPICDGYKEISLMEALEYQRKYPDKASAAFVDSEKERGDAGR